MVWILQFSAIGFGGMMASDIAVPKDKKIIAYDIDGTLNDFCNPFFRFLYDEHEVKKSDGMPYTEEDSTEYDIFRCITLPDTLPEKFRLNRIALFEDFARKGGYLSFEPVEGALRALEALSRDFRQIIVTSRFFSEDIFDFMREQTYRWLSATGISRYIDMVFFTKSSKDKEHFLKTLFSDDIKLKIVVEDKLGTALHATEAGIHSILMDRKYNRNGYNLEKFEGVIHRVDDFDGAYRKIRELEQILT